MTTSSFRGRVHVKGDEGPACLSPPYKKRPAVASPLCHHDAAINHRARASNALCCPEACDTRHERTLRLDNGAKRVVNIFLCSGPVNEHVAVYARPETPLQKRIYIGCICDDNGTATIPVSREHVPEARRRREPLIVVSENKDGGVTLPDAPRPEIESILMEHAP